MVLGRSRLAGTALRFTRTVAVRAALVRCVAVSEAALLMIYNSCTWTLHGSECVRAASKSRIRTPAGRNRSDAILLHRLPQARSLLLE